MSAVGELFRRLQRHLGAVVGADKEEIDELERLVGRPLPQEFRSYLLLAGRSCGNLRFLQGHKTIQPSVAASIAYHRPRKRGPKKRASPGLIFFGDGAGCQDCGPVFLTTEPQVKIPNLSIDADDPPVIGFDYDQPVLLAPRFTQYVRASLP